MVAYYNEIDPYAAEWLENLVIAGLVADGVVDRRDIRDVRPEELREFDQCHFFAGIGVWSYALRLAGWPDDRPIWTGSCPCQPFSSAGSRGGFLDKRHLWPAFHHLIRECRPPVVFGEQVASKDGLAWLDLVSTDLEGEGYAFGAVDSCAAGYGAPHIRQRLYFCSYDLRSSHGWMANTDDERPQGRCERRDGPDERAAGQDGVGGGMADAMCHGAESGSRNGKDPQGATLGIDGRTKGAGATAGVDGAVSDGESLARPTHGFWGVADWLFCRDGKWRPVEPGTFPLAHGAPARVGRLRAYGNAIVAPQAAEFISAVMDTVYPILDLEAGE